MKELLDVFTIAMAILLAGIFFSATKKIWHGFNSWRAGEQDMTELIGGMLMIVSPFIVFGLYLFFNIGDAAISPQDVKSLSEYAVRK